MLSQRAREHFRLAADPFLDDVLEPADVFLGDEQRYVREAMWQAATRRGFLAVIGESGAGKSVLRRLMINRIRREQHPITLIQPFSVDKGALTASAISEAIVGACSLEAPKRTIEARDRQVARVLSASAEAGNKHVLLLEEAHDLRIGTLKKLKCYWEQEAPDGLSRLLGVILVGQPELRAKLDERVNWEAREVIRRCVIAELAPLRAQDVSDYLALKFRRIGAAPEAVFTPDVPAAIAARLTDYDRTTQRAVSRVYPLSINNLLKRAANQAAEFGEPRVTREIVEGL